MKRRFFSLLLVLVLAIPMILGVIPAQAINTITVSVKPAAHWTNVYLYVWDDNQSSLTQWPGLPMNQGTDGWWTLEIPAGYTNVIASNAYATGEQTVDLKMDGYSDCWLTVIEVPDVHDDGIVYTDAACTKPFGGSAPSIHDDTVDLNDLHSLALVGAGIPGIRDWDPGDPAGDMTKVSDGVYTKVISLSAGSTIMFKIAGNDQWNEFFNYGGADLMTMFPGDTAELISDIHSRDITLTATKTGNLKFTIDLNGEAPTLSVEETTEETDVPAPPAYDQETYTVYARIPSDWTDPRIWCWNDSSQNPSNLGPWPGSLTMTENENGWYYAEVPVGYNYLLVNANGGGVQTMDMTIQHTETVWIDLYIDPNTPLISYKDPIPPICKHPQHTSDGRCSGCGFKVGHAYDSNYTCACGLIASDLKPVYFVNHTNYREVYAYWSYSIRQDDHNAPGVKMTAVAENIYSCWIPADAPYVTFNNGAEKSVSVKQADMTAELIVYDPLANRWITYQEAKTPSLPEESKPSNNILLICIIIGAVVLLVSATAVTILVIKKKK